MNGLLRLGMILFLPLSFAVRAETTTTVDAPTTAGLATAASPTTGSAGAEQWTEERFHAALKTKNPAYAGNGAVMVHDGKVSMADLSGMPISDLSPLRGLKLKALDLRQTRVGDITTLQGMPLVELGLEETLVHDISVLRGMPLQKLYLTNTGVKDISVLRGMPLTELNLMGTGVTDITPLAGAPLHTLWLNETPVQDITPLAQTPMMSLTLHRTGVVDLRPLPRSLERLHIAETNVTDLTPLDGMKLKRLIFSPERIARGLEVVRNMQSLEELGTSLDNRMPPAMFWQMIAQRS